MGISKIMNVDINLIGKILNTPQNLVSKFLDSNIEQLQPFQYLGYKNFNLLNYYPSGYNRDFWWGWLTTRYKKIGFTAGTVGEGNSDFRLFVYDILNDELRVSSQLGTHICGVEDENYIYYGLYDFPDSGTQAGMVKVNKSDFSAVRYIFNYHTSALGFANNCNYVFFNLAHGGSYNYLKYYNKINNSINSLVVFSSSYYIIDISKHSYNRKIIVTGLNYYSNQTSTPVSLVDVDNLSVNQLGTATGAAGIGNVPVIYKDRIFLSTPSTIYEYTISPFSLIATYNTPDSAYNYFQPSICFPTYDNEPNTEPLIFFMKLTNGTPAKFYIFNVETRQFKFLDLTNYVSTNSYGYYIPLYLKDYFVLAERSYNMPTNPVLIHIFKINSFNFWDII